MGNQVNCGCANNENCKDSYQYQESSQSSMMEGSQNSSMYNLHNNYFRNQNTSHNESASNRTLQSIQQSDRKYRDVNKHTRARESLTNQVMSKAPKQYKVENPENQIHIPSRIIKQHVNFDIPNQLADSSFSEPNISKISRTNDHSLNADQLLFKIASKFINEDGDDSDLGAHQSTQQSSPQKQKRQKLESHSQRRKRRVKRSIAREEDEAVLKEGEFLKLCPGVQRQVMRASRDLNGGPQYIDRWCQITQNKFRYYKNKIAAYRQPDKPLLTIPLLDVINIEQTKLNNDETQIEFLLTQPLTTYVLQKSLMEKIYQSPTRQQSKSPSPDREVIPGHLMRQPISRNQRLSYASTQRHQPSQQRMRQIHEEDQFNQTSKIEQINENHTFALMDSVDKNCWTRREEDWFNIEERLVFKNNKANLVDGNPKLIGSWIKEIYKQKAVCMINQEKERSLRKEESRSSYQLTFAYKS